MTSAEPGPATTPPNPERINSPVRIRLLKYPVPPNRLLGGVSLVLGLLTVAWPLGWAPAWTYALASLGAVAALAAVFLRWRRGPVLAVAAAIISSAVSHAGIPVLAAEGLFILAYLLVADAPPGMIDPGRWLRRQTVLLVAGLITSGAVLAAYAVHQSSSAWIAFACLAAAVAAYLIALPRVRAAGRPRAVATDPEHMDPIRPGRTGTV